MNNVVVDNGVVSTDLFTSQFVETHAERTTRVFVSYLFVPSLQDHENCIAFGGKHVFLDSCHIFAHWICDALFITSD